MTHLGTQVSALADGQLSPAATERALAHVAVCPECEAELRAARAAHRALAAAMDVPAAPALTARLLAIGCPPPRDDAARRGPRGASLDDSVPLPGSGARGDLPADYLSPGMGHRGGRTRVLLMAGAGLGVVVAGLISLGDDTMVVPSGHPAQAMSMLGQVPTAAPAVVTAGSGPAVDLHGEAAHEEVLRWMDQEGWSCPVALPHGLEITAVQVHQDGSLEIDLVGEDGSIVVTERRGRLDDDAVAGAAVTEIEGHQVHVLSTAPWHGVWQSGGTVVDVIAQAPPETVTELVGAYPPHPYDDGIPARISRGWTALAGTWSP